MINQDLFNDVFILYLSGAAKMKNAREIELKDKGERNITIEFVNNLVTKAIVRSYYDNGVKESEREFENGQMHGKYTYWYEDGFKRWDEDYRNGQLHGKRKVYYANLTESVYEYQNGVRIK